MSHRGLQVSDPNEASPPYFERLIGIIGKGDPISSLSSDVINSHDKKTLVSFHNNAEMYLAHPEVNRLLFRHDRPEQEYEGSHEATEAADELVPVKLKELILGYRNTCVVLYGTLCVNPFKFGRIYSVLEEVDTGMAVALSIVSPDYLFNNQSFAIENFPKGIKIAVKEPVFIQGDGGLLFIDVDKPSSIERVQSLPASTDVNVTVGEEKFKKWLDCANEDFDAKEWDECIRHCSKCVICFFKGIRVDRRSVLDVYYNIYQARMELGQHEKALEDITKYCNLDPADSHGIECMIRSQLSLGGYKEAFNSVQNFKDFKDFTSTYREWGATYFDLGEVITGEPGPQVYIPNADFIGPVEIKMTSNGCGRGLFATEAIKTGQVLMITKALATCSQAIDDPTENGLLQNVKNALSSCGNNTLKLFLSHSIGSPPHLRQLIPKMSEFIVEPTSNSPVYRVGKIYDNFILHILKRIALDDSSPTAMLAKGRESFIFSLARSTMCYGVWLLASFINHSCAPNAARINLGDILRIHATKPIEKGQEITIPYFGVLVPYTFRQASCKSIYGFGCECKCRRCAVEILFLSLPANGLYYGYFKACIAERNHRSYELGRLFTELENRLKIFIEDDIVSDRESEAWIRSSFMAIYLARITYRKGNFEPRSIEEYLLDENSLLRAADSMMETCPGDIQFLRFCHSWFHLWGDFLAQQRAMTEACEKCEITGACEKCAEISFNFMKRVCIFVYGQQRKAVEESLLKKLTYETLFFTA